MSTQIAGFLYLVKLFVKWKKLLLIVFILSFLVSMFIAYMLPVYYKSVSMFYPYGSKAYDPRYIFSSSNDVQLFGTGDDVDRIITIGNSREIADYIIKKYNLIDRYDIDRSNPYYYINVRKKFMKNYSIKEDMRSAIIVTVYDQNPDTAALIVNDIVNYIDSLNRLPLIEANIDLLTKVKINLQERYRKMDSLMNITRGISLQQTDMSQIVSTSTEMMHIYNNLNEVETRMSILNENFKTLFIIEKAIPVIKKAKPIRWLIVMLSTAGSLLLTFIFIILYDQYQQQYKNIVQKN